MYLLFDMANAPMELQTDHIRLHVHWGYKETN